jgi:hypothetical protein
MFKGTSQGRLLHPEVSGRPVDSRRPRWQVILGVLGATLVIIFPLIWWVGPSLPWEEAVLATGRTYLDVPIATMYTAPLRLDGSVDTRVELFFSSGFDLSPNSGVPPASIEYQWSLVSGTDLPVRFVLEDGSNISRVFLGDTNSFSYYPAGRLSRGGSNLSATATGPGVRSVFVAKWVMDYTVRKMGVLENLLPAAYLQVDYSLTVADQGALLALPAANVSLPTAGDLVSLARLWSVTPPNPTDLYAAQVTSGDRPPSTDLSPFQFDLEPVALDAGAAGTLYSRISSTFWWSLVCRSMVECWPRSQSVLHVSVPDETVWFQVFVDHRFGSLLIEYTAPPAA